MVFLLLRWMPGKSLAFRFPGLTWNISGRRKDGLFLNPCATSAANSLGCFARHLGSEVAHFCSALRPWASFFLIFRSVTVSSFWYALMHSTAVFTCLSPPLSAPMCSDYTCTILGYSLIADAATRPCRSLACSDADCCTAGKTKTTDQASKHKKRQKMGWLELWTIDCLWSCTGSFFVCLFVWKNKLGSVQRFCVAAARFSSPMQQTWHVHRLRVHRHNAASMASINAFLLISLLFIFPAVFSPYFTTLILYADNFFFLHFPCKLCLFPSFFSSLSSCARSFLCI